jgi:hypothetical protein
LRGPRPRLETPEVIDFLRAFAKTGRLAEIAEAIEVVARNCETNRNWKRGYLRARVAGILANNFFTQFEPAFFEAFIAWSGQNPRWAKRIGAAETGEQLVAAVTEVEAAVRASCRVVRARRGQKPSMPVSRTLGQ